jgi:hypothetical protein
MVGMIGLNATDTSMALTEPQRAKLEAVILAYLKSAQAGRFERAASAFQEEAQLVEGSNSIPAGNGGDALLSKAWRFAPATFRRHLLAPILAYLSAQGGRFALTAAAFTEATKLRGGEEAFLGSSGGTLRTWTLRMPLTPRNTTFFNSWSWKFFSR